jgi:L-histidine Nalpha-methyltransferase
MSIAVAPKLSEFALDVARGLSDPQQKRLPPKYLYDDVGSALFEAITLLPEYGLTRADGRLLRDHSKAIVRAAGVPSTVVELGSGSGKKTRYILNALQRPTYFPIDISEAALQNCVSQLQDVADVHPVIAEWDEGLRKIANSPEETPVLLLFLGSSIGNFSRDDVPQFFANVRASLRPGDFFLLGADLRKPASMLIEAYDDAAGVTAAFNRNLLVRINRELGGNFHLRSFQHEARWNDSAGSVEMHLVSLKRQRVQVEALAREFVFEAGESIWTESSHKFRVEELDAYAAGSGFKPVARWVDQEWPFVEALWKA